MPIFEYRCGACGETFEELVRGSSETVTCPVCASSQVTKLLSVPSTPRMQASAPVRNGGGGCCSGGACGCHN